MKILRIEAFALKFAEGDSFGGHAAQVSGESDYALQPGWRGIYSQRIETMVVRIETDTGLVGWGEGQSPIAPEVSANIVERILRPFLVGRYALATQSLRDEMYSLMNLRGHTGGFMLDAIAGVDIALWDIKGKALGAPVHVLLGGPARNGIPAYVSGLRGSSDQQKVADLKQYCDKGFHRFKLFGGFGRRHDARLMRQLIDACGAEGSVAFDALWNYDAGDAAQLGLELQQAGCAWFEAPVAPEDIRGHAELARMLAMPVAGGETERTRFALRAWLAAGALDIVQPDIGRCGITEGVRMVELAELHNVPVALHCGIASPMMIAASLQLAMACPQVRVMEYQPVAVANANRLLRSPIRCEAGAFVLPADGPGLGLDVDEEAIRQLAAAR